MPKREVRGDLPTFHSVDEFLEGPLPRGAFCVHVDGVPVDFNYEDRGYATTVTFFHAALSRKVEKLPVFLGRAFSQDAPVNRLFVSDPTLALDERLNLAWYAGSSSQPTLQSDLSRIFVKAAGRNRMIYFGASGGGFAALSFSARHRGSLAIPVNPQTNIALYTPAAVCRWTNLAWGFDNNPHSGELAMPPTLTDLCDVYSQPLGNSVVYVQNTGDDSHMQSHWRPFSEALHPGNPVLPILEFSGEGHVAPPSERLAAVIERCAEQDSWDEISMISLEESPLRHELP